MARSAACTDRLSSVQTCCQPLTSGCSTSRPSEARQTGKPERLFGHPLDTIRSAGDSLNFALRRDVEAELGGDNHLVAHRGQGLAGDLLAKEQPLDFGNTENRCAPFIDCPNNPDGFLPVG